MESPVRMIDPNLFTRLMRLPDAARGDLLEFLGATPVGDAQLAEMIERVATRVEGELRPMRAEPN